jgi:PIN domain nuclease of toxin-antitoxin system
VSFLFDTQLLIWMLREPERLLPDADRLLSQMTQPRHFSVATIWEASIKLGTKQSEVQFDIALFYQSLGEAGFIEIDITAAHALAVSDLPAIHRDPFDRIMIAQANVEGLTLVTADAVLGRYPARVMVM